MSSTLSSAQSTFTPALAPPPGVTPDPHAHNDLVPFVIFTETLCIGLTGILLIIRCFVRAYLMRQWGFEDWGAIIGWLLFLGYSSVVAAGVHFGGGQHQWNVTSADVKEVLFLNNVDEITYGFAVLFIKATLLYLYKQIFAPAKYSKRWWAIMIVLVLNTTFYIGLTFAKIFLCSPRAAIWDKSIVDKKCGSLFGVLIASGIWNTSSDLIILGMPVLFVWRLRLTRQKRLGLIAVFGIGLIAPAFSVLGIVMRVRYTNSKDSTYGQWRVLLYAYAELTAGLICTGIPVLPRFYKWIRGDKGASSFLGTPGRGRARYNFNSGDSPANRKSTMKNGIQGLGDKDLLATNYVELGDVHDEDKRYRTSSGSGSGSRPGTNNGDERGASGIRSTYVNVARSETPRNDGPSSGGGMLKSYAHGLIRPHHNNNKHAEPAGSGMASILKTTDISVEHSERLDVRHDVRHELGGGGGGGDHESEHSGNNDFHHPPMAVGSAV